MALVLQASIEARAFFYLDVIGNEARGASITNNDSTRSISLSLVPARGAQGISTTVGPGQTWNQTLPGNVRFEYDSLTAAWSLVLKWVS